MSLAIVVSATILLGALGAWRWRAAGAASRGEGLLCLGLGLAALFSILLLAALSVAYAQSDMWSFIRLAPSMAQARGIPLYAPEGQGPLLGWSYGPVMPLVLLPLAVFSDPSVALSGAALLNVALLLVPLLLSIWRGMPGDPGHRVSGVVILAALAAVLMHVAPSMYWMRRIQTDSFALGLGLLGQVVLLGAQAGRPVAARRRWASALFFVLSAFSKHNEVVLAGIPCLYLWLRDGRPSALRMLLALAALASGALVLSILAWGWKALFLNLWLVPSRHPWSFPGLGGLLFAAELFWDSSGVLVAAVLALGVLDVWIGPRQATVREWLAERPWTLPAAAALLIFPVSLVGRIKIGGDENSFHSVYFAVAALGMIAARWTADGRRPLFRRLVPELACLLALAGTLHLWPGSGALDAQFSGSQLRREYRFAREHRDEVWFGADPLVTIYTDGKVYHQGYGVFDRTLANLPPPPSQLKDHLPARLRWVSSPLPPFWKPEGLVPITPPAGVEGTRWFGWPPVR